ncbi:MAG TPA: ComEC/Rec2 family competence protein, partial [Candidatus Woesebacteria bacterium]|nr:ComEC/Rec2 family competence protein [Candidatus Woesebacteria bacterium]
KSGFSRGFYNDLKNIGIVHIVVVSGMNVMILARFFIESLAGLIGRKWAILLGLSVIWFYSLMIGWQPPILRAVLLVTFLYWAQLLGRKFNLGRVIVLIILMMILADYTMLSQVSFWLTFIGFGAVVLDPYWVWLWITPVLALVFGRISLIAPLANALVLFLVEIITIIGGLGAVLNSKFILWLIMPLLRYIIIVTNLLGQLKWSSLTIKFNWPMMIGSYLLLIWFYLKRRDLKQKKPNFTGS